MRGLGYYVVNLLAIVSYLGVRDYLPTIFDRKFSNVRHIDEVFSWEWQTLLTWVGIVGIKVFRSKTNEAALASIFFYSKAVVFVLLSTADYRLAAMYALCCFVIFLLFPPPFYDDPATLVFLTPENFLALVTASDTESTWLVEFYASFSMECANFSRTMADISSKYTTERLRFGKLDVGAWPAMAASLSIEPQSQLPSLVLFEKGREHSRLPRLNQSKQELSKVAVVKFFELEWRHTSSRGAASTTNS